MADIARDVPVPGRAAVPALLRPAAGECGVILMHGSGGDMNSGRLPLYTAALADAGFTVLRFTIKPPSMPTRIKCCQVRFVRPFKRSGSHSCAHAASLRCQSLLGQTSCKWMGRWG